MFNPRENKVLMLGFTSGASLAFFVTAFILGDKDDSVFVPAFIIGTTLAAVAIVWFLRLRKS